MFDFIRKHTRVLYFILLVLIIPSFVFFGLEGYTGFNDKANQPVAKVGSLSITQNEWDAAHREQIERVRRQSPTVDIKTLETPELKAETLDALVRERLMFLASDKLHLVTSDDRMLRLFRKDEQFAFLRNPDGSLNKEVLAAQGMSSEGFAQRLRQDLSSRQVMQGVDGTVLSPAAAANVALDAFFQQREIQVQRFLSGSYTDKVKPTDAEIEAFYKDPANAALFQAPEQASIEYLVLDGESIKKDLSLKEDDLKKYYTENAARYTAPEERRASHILISVDKGASAEVRAQAKAKADGLLIEARKAPAAFADLARKNSQDPGSAPNGGDLDFFGRGAMVKPFEDAAFAMKSGDISEVVTSDFGFHIIQLTGVRGGEKRSFDSVRPEIEGLLRQQLAQQKYSELAAEFSNMVYEQADSLQPTADKFKLELRTAKGLARKPVPGATGPLASPKLLDAVFGGDAVRNKRNTDAVETAPNQMVSARVTEYLPARLLPLTDVKPRVLAEVSSRQAAALARKDGEARLAALKADPAIALTEPVLQVSRGQPRELPREVVDAVLRAPATSLPAMVGVDLGTQGYAVIKLSKVLGRDPEAPKGKDAETQFARALAEAESQAYLAALKIRFKVDSSAAAAIAAKAASAASN